jgi:phage-related minor tail protein
MESAASAIIKIGDDPAKAIQSLDDSMNFLTVAELQQIEHLQAVGEKSEAARVAIAALGGEMHKRAAQANQDGPWFTKAFDRWKQGWSNIGSGIGQVLTLGGNKTAIDKYTDALNEYHAALKKVKDDLANGVGGISLSTDKWFANSQYQRVMDIWNSPDFQKQRSDKLGADVSRQVQSEAKDAVQQLAELGISLDGVRTKE